MSDTATATPAPPSRPWWMQLLLNWVLPIAGVAVAFVVVGQLRGPRLSGPAPAFALRDLHGETVELASLRGEPVILNFWATWCGPCRVEIPSFAAFASAHPDVHVIGIVADGPAPKVAHFAEDAGITYPVLMGTRAVMADYGVTAFPTTIVLDAEGTVVSTHMGIMTRPQLWWATHGL